jgi:outer membrane protein OmpA-like peptidoglycan-associated protein
MNERIWLGALLVGVALVWAGPAAHAQHNFGARTPSAQEIVDQLDPPKSRGLTVGAAQRATPAAPAAAQPAAPTPLPSISMQIQFDFDSDRIGAESTAALASLARALQDERLAGKRFDVVGHTDATGGFDYNMGLSQRRASAVRNYLAGQGVDPSRLKTIGKGPTELLNRADPAGAENRRVEIAVGS